MRTIAVANHKGGSAKTTTTVNLAAALGESGHEVLVIDMDPQGSASAWLGVPDPDVSVMEAIRGRDPLAHLIYETTAPGVQLVAASPELVAIDRRSETDIALGFMRALEGLPARWDVVLVDCPPSLGYLAIAPLTVCREVLVPVEAHYMALAGVTSLVETMEQVRARLNPGLKLGGVVACRVNRTMHARAVVARLGHRYPEAMVRTQIRESIRLAEASAYRLPITLYAPDSAGADDYRGLAVELFEVADASPRVVRRVMATDVQGPPASPVTIREPVIAANPFDRLRQAFRRPRPASGSDLRAGHEAPEDGAGSPPGPER
jgi:chromosome partitioning protein